MQYFLLLPPASQFSGFCETSNDLFMQKIPQLEFIQNSNLRLNIQNKVQEVLTLFFKTLEKQPCKWRSDVVLNEQKKYQNKLCYLEDRVSKRSTACITTLAIADQACT